MVYQAIAEYWAGAKEPAYNLNVDILFEGRTNADKYNFNRENHYATRTSKVRRHSSKLSVAHHIATPVVTCRFVLLTCLCVYLNSYSPLA